MTLLIIDTQKGITNRRLYNFAALVENIQRLIAAARENGIEVIFARHDDGYAPLTKGEKEFDIFEDFTPRADEKIFDKTVNSPFRKTGLLEYLRTKDEKALILAGLQTDYCIDAAVKCGFEHGFHIYVPNHANSTFDNGFLSAEASYRYYNEFVWPKRYAECLPVSDMIRKMRENG